jgi:archaellum component FlaC
VFKLFIIIILSGQYALADDLSYKDRSNEGENKYERIGKLETYLSSLSSSLAKIHTDMKKDFKKDLKALEEKLRQEMESNLESKFKKLEAKIAEVSTGEDYAKKKYAEESRGQLKTLKNRIIDLLEKVEILEARVKDMDSRP